MVVTTMLFAFTVNVHAGRDILETEKDVDLVSYSFYKKLTENSHLVGINIQYN